MKRTLLLALLSLTVLAACATMSQAPAAVADVNGVITQIDGGTLTVKAATGDVQVNIGRGTRVFWPNGQEGDRANLTVGHSIDVWLNTGSQSATRVNIKS